MGGKYGLEDRSRFGEPALGMAIVTTQVAEVGSIGNGVGKYQDSFFGGTILLGCPGVFLVGLGGDIHW